MTNSKSVANCGFMTGKTVMTNSPYSLIDSIEFVIYTIESTVHAFLDSRCRLCSRTVDRRDILNLTRLKSATERDLWQIEAIWLIVRKLFTKWPNGPQRYLDGWTEIQHLALANHYCALHWVRCAVITNKKRSCR